MPERAQPQAGASTVPWEEPGAGGIAELAAAVRDGARSALDLCEAALARIAARDGELHAFAHLHAEQARAEAREERARRGPLAGLPLAVKDGFAVAGWRTTAGRRPGSGALATEDAFAVARLREAGAVLVGTTNMPELATAAVTDNVHYGTARNPWDPARTPGGSSGGSAVAVAAGMVPAALGTDTGGSVLIPAALTGICGLRPTAGRVSTRGVVPLSWTLDTVGAMARTPEDLACVLGVLAAHDRADPLNDAFLPPVVPAPRTPGESPLAGLRVGALGGWFRDVCDPAVTAAVSGELAALAASGALVHDVELADVERVFPSARAIVWPESATAFAELLDGEEQEGLAASVTLRWRDGALVPATEYAQAQRWRRTWQHELRRAFAAADVLVAATVPIPAPPVGGEHEDATRRLVQVTYPFCFAGTPALSVPCGLVDGLPVGLLLVAPWGEERRLLAVGRALAERHPVQRPPAPEER